jgi:predicted glycosyltransferase
LKEEARGRPARILVYSHDTYGLGHLRRNLLLSRRLSRLAEPPSILLATGSPRAQAFDLPPGCDIFKLPAVLKQSDGTYEARTLPIPFEEIKRIRSEMLVSAFRRFGPDLVLVDHAPAGVEGELLPMLREIHRRPSRPLVVLGLREIIDSADRVDDEWRRLSAWEAIDEMYDRVLVYGDPRILTTAVELGLPKRLPGRVFHTGYLGRPVCPVVGAPALASEPTILVTAGGGGDGHRVLRVFASYLESLPGRAPFRSVVVTGPFLSRERFDEISSRLRATPHRVAVLRFTNRMEDLLQAAHGVLSMGGYNSIVEVLSEGIPALVVPRDTPRLEQLIRMERITPHSAIDYRTFDRFGVGCLRLFIERIVDGTLQRTPARLDLDGLTGAANRIEGFLARAGIADDAERSDGRESHASRIG